VRGLVASVVNSRRALVVDDSRAMRAVLRIMLEPLGFGVQEAESGSVALEAIRGAAPELVLLDWNMPGLSGLDCVRSLRGDRAWDGVKILMVTTEVDLEHVKEALKAGAQEYLMKPFTVDTLKEKLALMGFPSA